MTETTVTFTPAAAPLAEKLLDRAREILARYPGGRQRSALLPLLHLVQSEEGYVSPAGVAFCAELLGINKAQVGAVATFYTMYKRKPTGEYLVSVCTNTMCNVLGGQEVYDALTEHLGVGHDETTADGTITLEHAECLAACDYGPVLTVNYDFYDNVTPDAAVGLVDRLAKGERPEPTRGARLCSLKEMSLQLAGFADPRAEAVADGPAGAPTLRGVTLAQEHGIAVADFDPETPIPAVPEADRKPATVVASTPPPGSVVDAPAESPAAAVGAKVARVAKKVAGAAKAVTKSAAEPAAPPATESAEKPAATAAKRPAAKTAAVKPAADKPAADKPAGRSRPARKTSATSAADAGADAQERNLQQGKENQQ
ncbi:MAG TPA: NADH-quinone oxidoreductase subunit NuoE [Actinoplanes sp.]|nr:NADH-quinone oxidoreductase subunit NuoE [Actinoplanes sp.]